MLVGQEFDKLEDGYTEKIRRWVPHYDELIHSLVAGLPDDFEPQTTLDLGAGNGNSTFAVRQRFPGVDMVLVDASAKMVLSCAERFGTSDVFTYVEKYMQELSFMPKTFDLVVAGLSLHHLQEADKQVLFSRIYEWLRPGGRFLACDIFVDTKDEQNHQQALAEWERIAREQGSSDEDWQYLMEHYAEYDHPDSFDDQMKWLRESGFPQVSIAFSRGYFGTIQAVKAMD